tara:strand:+ start:5041 stop:5277 length:237 start_codon:yes stop_codon:yes gene_type:complete
MITSVGGGILCPKLTPASSSDVIGIKPNAVSANVDRHEQRPILLDFHWNDQLSLHKVIHRDTSPALMPWHAQGKKSKC